jgi:hypothetical protein
LEATPGIELRYTVFQPPARDKTAERAVSVAYQHAEVAALKLLKVRPTTIAGAAAVLQHYAATRSADDGEPISISTMKQLGASYGVLVAQHVARALERLAT